MPHARRCTDDHFIWSRFGRATARDERSYEQTGYENASGFFHAITGRKLPVSIGNRWT